MEVNITRYDIINLLLGISLQFDYEIASSLIERSTGKLVGGNWEWNIAKISSLPEDELWLLYQELKREIIGE